MDSSFFYANKQITKCNRKGGFSKWNSDRIQQKKLKAMEKVKRANAELAKEVREDKEQLRKAQDRHKYMMGGCVVKYFPEAYDFSEQEMNHIIARFFT